MAKTVASCRMRIKCACLGSRPGLNVPVLALNKLALNLHGQDDLATFWVSNGVVISTDSLRFV